MALRSSALLLFLGVLRCAAQAEPACGEASTCAEVGEEEGVSQLQTAHFASSCKSLAPQVTKKCNATEIMQCIGRLENEGSVETRLPSDCSESVTHGQRAGVHVYEVYNDYGTDHSFTGEGFCFGPPMVDFDYAMSCFGEIDGKCVEQDCMSCDGGDVSPAGATCNFKPGETKYMALWFKRMPPCSKVETQLTNACDISGLMGCIGGIDNADPVYTEFPQGCAKRAGIPHPGAKVYKVYNDLPEAQSLKGEDFCFGPPAVDFKYAMSCFGNDGAGSCEDQGCIKCDAGGASPAGESCDFKPFQTKYMVVWFESS